jgi:hypothetical protein
MSEIDWAGGDVVLACQLLTAATLAVQLLVLRPRRARHDLLLDARIIQDELDLAERLGHISATNVEIVAMQQLLCRVRQNPQSVGLVLERIPFLALAVGHDTGPVEAEYVGGALDRLSDAAQRYLCGAWPRAATLSAIGTGRSIAVPHPETDRADLRPEVDGQAHDSRDEERADVIQLPDDDLDSEFEDELDEDLDSDLEVDDPGNLDMMDDLDDDELRDDDRDLDDDLDDEFTVYLDHRLTPERSPDRDTADAADRPGSGQGPTQLPAWVELVRTETPRRTSALGQADRHARPFRPARSTAHSSANRIDPIDRSSVLPR